MADLSTYEALVTLCAAIQNWTVRLNELNESIGKRQIELAKAAEKERPQTARSLRNKGSTESLRPKDYEQPFLSQENESPDDAKIDPSGAPNSTEDGLRLVAAVRTTTPPPVNRCSRPKPVTPVLRQASDPMHGRPHGIRKRKTESLASAESNVPKAKARSMAVIYYDEVIQKELDDLVKLVSGSRNTMRKGKVALKMANMTKAADREFDAVQEEHEEFTNNRLATNGKAQLPPLPKIRIRQNGGPVVFGGVVAERLVAENPVVEGLVAGADSESDGEVFNTSTLNYVSTRQMGRSRDARPNANGVGLRNFNRRGGASENGPDIFDAVDKGLEWVQGQCQHAATQTLRDGSAAAEIDSMKRRLEEVTEIATAEITKLKELGEDGPVAEADAQHVGETRRRELRAALTHELEGPMDLEVDEEAEPVETMPPRLDYVRSRDFRR